MNGQVVEAVKCIIIVRSRRRESSLNDENGEQNSKCSSATNPMLNRSYPNVFEGSQFTPMQPGSYVQPMPNSCKFFLFFYFPPLFHIDREHFDNSIPLHLLSFIANNHQVYESTRTHKPKDFFHILGGSSSGRLRTAVVGPRTVGREYDEEFAVYSDDVVNSNCLLFFLFFFFCCSVFEFC